MIRPPGINVTPRASSLKAFMQSACTQSYPFVPTALYPITFAKNVPLR